MPAAREGSSGEALASTPVALGYSLGSHRGLEASVGMEKGMLEALALEDRDDQQQEPTETVAAAAATEHLHGLFSMPGSLSKMTKTRRVHVNSYHCSLSGHLSW